MNSDSKYAIFLTAVFGISAVILQTTLTPLIEINGWHPDFVVVIVLLTGRRFESISGSLSGFILGIMQDSLSPLPIGISALSKSIVGYAAGKTKRLRLEGVIYYLWILFLIFLNELIFYFFFQFKTTLPYNVLLFSRVFPNTLYTTLILAFAGIFIGKYYNEDK
jgi:rod shape-determining protein MreD